jgi:hypothetical protein
MLFTSVEQKAGGHYLSGYCYLIPVIMIMNCHENPFATDGLSIEALGYETCAASQAMMRSLAWKGSQKPRTRSPSITKSVWNRHRMGNRLWSVKGGW